MARRTLCRYALDVSNVSPPRKQMRRWEVPGDVRFITFSCQGRLPLFRNRWIAEGFTGALASTRVKHGVRLFAWVLMPEHVHLLCTPKHDAQLEPALRGLKMTVAKRALLRWRELDAPILAKLEDERGRPRFWLKGGGFDRNVRDSEELTKSVRYIHRNPVGRGLVSLPEDWPWSSVRWWMGAREGEVECDPPPGRPERWATWQGFK